MAARGIFSIFRGRPQEQPQSQHAENPIVIDKDTLQSMVDSLNLEKIKRTMMLFDTRWIREDSTSYIPTEEQIGQEAWSALVKAIHHGRVLGVAEVKDKGFIATYARLGNGNELLNIRYVLAEAHSLG